MWHVTGVTELIKFDDFAEETGVFEVGRRIESVIG